MLFKIKNHLRGRYAPEISVDYGDSYRMTQQKAEKEKIIKNALAKLSEEERKALNLPTKLVKTKG